MSPLKAYICYIDQPLHLYTIAVGIMCVAVLYTDRRDIILEINPQAIKGRQTQKSLTRKMKNMELCV